jgi:phosphate starvation-inducible PhoH-like protein
MNKRKITKKTRPQRDEIIEKPVKRSAGNFHIEFKNEQQRKAWQTIEQNEITFLIGPAGSAKSFISSAYSCSSILTKRQQKILLTRPIVEATASIGYLPGCQPLTQKIATSNGWTTMGEIKIGDKVIGRDGMPTEVLGIYPKGEKDTYKVTTFDGTSTICCADHLWYTQTREEKNKKQQGKVRVTRDIISDLENGLKHFLPRNEPVHFDKKELSIAPYTLGVLLGDGTYSDSHVRFASADQEIVDRVNDEIKPLGLYCQQAKKQYSQAWSYTLSSLEGYRQGAKPVKITEIDTSNTYYFSTNREAMKFTNCKQKTLSTRVSCGATVDGYKYEKNGEPWVNPVFNCLRNHDLLGKKAWDKFIPDDYKYSSVQDRIDILRGLCDTDGCCRERVNDQVNFYTTSLRLAEDVIEIVRSLGGKAKLRSRDRRVENNTNFTPRRISYEVSIAMPESINPFYLKRKAERFKGKNIAHIEIISIEKVGNEKVQCIKVDNPEHLYLTDDFIVTHNTFEEKVNPYITPIYDALDELVGPVGFQREIVNKSIQIRPLNYMRGCNFNDAICLHDEAQNNDFKSLLLYITRLGRNSKMIINGDPNQVDIKNSALMEVINKLEGVPGIGVVRFDKSAIVRNPLISQILDRLAPDQSI